MKMGVREFRERISEVVNGEEPVVVTKNGRVVGRYLPASMTAPSVDMAKWLQARGRFRSEWQGAVPDWAERLLDLGLDEHGEPIEDSPRWPPPESPCD